MEDDFIFEARLELNELGNDLSRLDAMIQDWRDSIQDEGLIDQVLSDKSVTTTIARFTRLFGVVTTVAAAAKEIYDWTLAAARESSGLNRGLEEANELEQRRLEIIKERLRLRIKKVESNIRSEDGEPGTPPGNGSGNESGLDGIQSLRDELRGLEADLESSLKNQAEVLQRYEAGLKTRNEENLVQFLNRQSAVEDRLRANIEGQVDKARADVDARRKAVEALAKSIERLEELEESQSAKRVQRQDRLNESIQREILTNNESTARSSGDDQEARRIGLDREISRIRSQFSGSEEPGRVEELIDSVKRRFEAEADALKRQSDERAEKEAERLAERERRAEERKSARDERGLESFKESRIGSNNRIADLRRSLSRLREDQGQRVSGFSGLTALGDRIAEAAARGVDRDYERRIEDLNRDILEAEMKQARTAEKMSKDNDSIKTYLKTIAEKEGGGLA